MSLWYASSNPSVKHARDVEPNEYLHLVPTSYRRPVMIALALAGTVLFALAYARYATFHNQTFDLAFYTRMSWGLVRFRFYDPFVGGHVLGLHVSPVLVPLGALGAVFDGPPVLLLAQAISVAATGYPLAALGARRLGPWGAALGAASIALHPNPFHVATFEFHPGTMAILPLAWACERAEQRDARGFAIAVLAVLACREDLGILTAALSLALAVTERTVRRPALLCALGSILYVALFLLVLHPLFRPEHGSLELHYGKWGSSAASAIFAVFTRPLDVIAHLSEPRRLVYVPMVLATYGFLPVARPRFALAALPLFGMNLLSDFPTTCDLDSHYLTPALPLLAASAIEGTHALAAKWGARNAAALALGAIVVAELVAGVSPFAFDYAKYVPDAESAAAAEILAAIPDEASVQAPYGILAHLAERPRVYLPVPPDRGTELTTFDVRHRERFAHSEDLIRTAEEPIVRDWLARPDQGLVVAASPYLLFRAGLDPRRGIGGRAIVGRADPSAGRRLAACLRLLGAHRFPAGEDDAPLALDLVASGPCPSDLAIRIGVGQRPRRVDLLFDGLLSPVHLETGDHLRSLHVLDLEEKRAFRAGRLRVGLLRQSGARPEHDDPVAIDLEAP